MAMGLLSRRTRRLRAVIALLSLVVIASCSQEEGGPGVYPGRGIVEDVDVENAQVLIDHEDIIGLMPAMTMSFVVPDAEVLGGLARGQIIDFDLRFTGRSYEVEGFEVIGEAPHEAGWRKLGDGLVRTRPAPDFDLIDQDGGAVSLTSLGDRVLVIDFIYTECPGPCPIQTTNQVALQRRIPKELLERIQLVSISLDPKTDQPKVLREYALARGADLRNWSFLTGEVETVATLIRDFGVGSVRQESGTIDHTLITFLVQHGRVMEKYTMSEGQSEALLRDAVALARARRDAPGEPTGG